jgi:SAM-dependent methyltransferase
MWDNRRRLIRQLAPGRSFLDLGGMFGIAGEMAFLAEASGATRVVLFDGMDPSDDFAATHRANSSSVEFVQGDFHDPAAVAALGKFDIVWCTGVIYHSPHPLQQLRYLRQLTEEHLVLGTHVIPEISGIEQACVLYPGISSAMQDTIATFHGGRERFPGMAAPFDTTPLMAYANMWWGISPSALRSMLHFSGFQVTEEHVVTPFWLDLVARPGGQSTNIYPPFDQSRERARQRHADTATDQLPRWAASQLRDIRED